MLTSETGPQCVHLYVCAFSICRLLIVVRSYVCFYALTSAICFVTASKPYQCFGILLTVFIPVPLSVGILCDTHASDSSSVSERTDRARKLRCHTHGFSQRVLWHLSRERELCLCERYCNSRAKPDVYTYNMRLVSKVHSLHPITESTPSHFLHSTLIYFW